MIKIFRKIKKKLRLTTVGAVIVLSVLFVFLIITSVIGVIVYLNSDYVRFVRYDDINKVKYAKPTEEAKNFDIDAYIASLPEIDYKKVDYPVKETYEYKFNGYTMTIDIPEGFRAYEIPLTEKPKIRNTKSMKDSCVRFPDIDVVCLSGSSSDLWYYFTGKTMNDSITTAGLTVDSDNKLCIAKNEDFDKLDCNGLLFRPYKSKYSGITARDFYFYSRITPESKFKKGVGMGGKKYKQSINNKNFFTIIGGDFSIPSPYYDNLLNDNQGLSFGVTLSNFEFNKSLYPSIIESIKIK